jgi:hypothetical protein
MIETAVFCADMDLDSSNGVDEFANYLGQTDTLTASNYREHHRYLVNGTQMLLEERLFLKEKYRRPSFNEILNDLSILKSKKEGVDLANKLRELYKEFSGHSHVSGDTLSNRVGELRREFGFFVKSNYVTEEFRYNASLIWDTMDAIFCLIILVQCWYYDYSSPHDYLSQVLKHNGKDSWLRVLINSTKKNRIAERLPLFTSIHKDSRKTQIKKFRVS